MAPLRVEIAPIVNSPSFRKMGAANLLSGEFGTSKVFAHYFCVLWKIGFILGAALPLFDPPYNPFGNPIEM